MTSYFPHDSYHTPSETDRDWLDRLQGSGRFLFHLRFIAIITYGRWLLALGRYDRAAYAASGYATFKLIERSGGKFHITGLDHIRAVDGPVVFVSNHMSALENNVMPGIIDPIKRVTFVIKATLLRYPIFGPLLRSQRTIAVSRHNPREDFQQVMMQGSALLADGTSIIVYPEGTRRQSFDPQRFNSLGVKLAKRAGVPVIPIAVKTDFWQNGRYLRDMGPIDRSRPIQIAFGRAIDSANQRNAHQAALDFIGGKLADWGVPTTAPSTSTASAA